ncbi:MAG TPA: hypothetical protein VF119_05980 [Candidatus Limnocylindrales bacterium]
MTAPTRLERTLPVILDELAAGPAPVYLDDVFARTAQMRQRPGWTFPERWIPMADITRSRAFVPAPPWRLLAIALTVLALVATALVFVGTQRRVPPPFGPARNGLIPYVSAGDIYVGDPVTGKTRLLVGGSEDDAAPGFSPDGAHLAFIRDVGRAIGTTPAPVHLFVVRDDGTGLTRITTRPIPTLVWASWTPDGRRLAVVQPYDGVNQLELYETDGAKPPHRITTAAGIDSLTFRPPDGGQILFRALVDGRYGLFVMDADGTNLQTLIVPTSGTDLGEDLNGATYSADGSRIFYQRWTPGSIQLWVMNADGTDPHEFVSVPGQGWDGLPAPSPDGRWIAYWHVLNDRATQRLAVVRADGTGPIILTGPELSGNANWTWAPDSSKILMIPESDGPGSAYLLDPMGGPETKVPWTSDLDLDWQRAAL